MEGIGVRSEEQSFLHCYYTSFVCHIHRAVSLVVNIPLTSRILESSLSRHELKASTFRKMCDPYILACSRLNCFRFCSTHQRLHVPEIKVKDELVSSTHIAGM